MAISLKRMRELEEKVKLIPSLEIEVHSLKNEKFELLEKLEKLKSTLRLTEHNLNEMKKEEQKIAAKVISIETKPTLRDVGITCRVLTRDVGITPIVLKNRTIATETIVDELFNEYLTAKEKKSFFKSEASQTQSEIESRSTITDLGMADISQILEKKEKKLTQKPLYSIALLPRSFERLNKGIQTTIKEPITVLQVIEKRETAVQVDGQKKQIRDAGCSAKPKMYDASTDIRPKTREHGSSDDRTTDLLCDRCKNLKTRTVGVGFGNVKLEEPKIDAVLLSRSKSFQLTDSKPKVTTRTVGVGTLIPVKKLTSTKGVGTHDLTGITTKHTGTNTPKVSLVDTGTETETHSITGVIPYEKHNDDTKISTKTSSTAKENANKEGSEGTKEPQPSKIPRPKSNQTTPVMERKKFMRQDTYTKLPQQTSFDTGKKTKSRYVFLVYLGLV